MKTQKRKAQSTSNKNISANANDHGNFWQRTLAAFHLPLAPCQWPRSRQRQPPTNVVRSLHQNSQPHSQLLILLRGVHLFLVRGLQRTLEDISEPPKKYIIYVF